MINLQYEYAKLIQEELDKNTQGLRFEVSLNNLKTNSDLQRFLSVPNTYATELKRYIPVVIEAFDGDFAELENMSAAEYFANMTMLIPTDDFDVNNQVIEETFVLVSQALNDMSRRTRAKVFPLGDKCYILPKNNNVELDLSAVNGVNLDLEIEFTNFEEQDILETLGGVKLTKDAQFVKFGSNNIIDGYETYKRYKFEFRRNEFGSYEVNGLDMQLIASDLGSVVKLLAEYNKVYSVIVYDDTMDELIVADDFTILSDEGVIKWGSEGTITLNFSLPRRLTNQMTLGEYNYQEFEVNTSGAYNDKAFVGQHIEYYLNGVRIFPVSRDEGYIGEPDNARFLGSNQGNRSVIEQTSIGKEYAVYYIPEPKVINLLEQITNESPNANTLYELKIVYPLFKREHTTVLSQGGLSIVNSTPLGISFALEIADNIIQEQIVQTPNDVNVAVNTSSSFSTTITYSTSLDGQGTGSGSETLSGGQSFDLNQLPPNTLLTLTAADNAIPGGLVFGGSGFTRWVINGVNQPLEQKQITIFVTQDLNVVAIYDSPLSGGGGIGFL